MESSIGNPAPADGEGYLSGTQRSATLSRGEVSLPRVQERPSFVRLLFRRLFPPTLRLGGAGLMRRIVPGRFISNRSDAAWDRGLDELISNLGRVNRSMDEEFLSIGSELEVAYNRSREVARTASSVMEAMSGEEVTGTIGALQEIFAQMRQMEEDSNRKAKTLRGILEQQGAIPAYMEDFQKILRMLRMLSISTKIETARFRQDDADLDALAESISKLAEDIASKTVNILAQSQQLGLLIEESLSKAERLGERQRGQAQAIVDQLMESLSSLSQKRKLSRSSMQGISARYDELSGGIQRIVMSMQFHDITRQRFEHIQQALAEAADNKEQLDQGRTGHEASANFLMTAADVFRLQAAQLRHSSDELISAVRNIISDLSLMVQSISDMSEEARKMAEASGGGGSFLSEMEQGLSFIQSSLAEYAEVNRELAESMSSVSAMTSGISSTVKDIGGIEREIKLIALNAIIRAERIGEGGASLSVLAESVHQLSVDTGEKTRMISDTFRTIIGNAETLSANFDEQPSTEDASTGSMSERLRLLLDDVSRMNGGISNSLSCLEGVGADLSGGIEKIIANIHVHEETSEVAAGVIAGLNEMVEHLHSLVPGSEGFDNSAALEALAGSYTMQNEREIHRAMRREDPFEAVVMAGDGTLDVHSEPCPPSEEEDFGDNVELF